MRAAIVIAVCAVALAACGEKPEPDVGAIPDRSADAPKGKRTVAGCIELWNGPHLGSTRLRYLAERHEMAARVQVAENRCVVAFASADASVYGRYVEKAGSWSLDTERAPARVARRVTRAANATGHENGTLSKGAP